MPGTRFEVSNTQGQTLMPPSQLTLSLDSSKFCAYHAQNPHIYQAFKTTTLKAIAKGYKNYGAKSIFEIIRWETAIASNDIFKVNNNYTPFYARMFEKEFPEHEDFFRKRNSRFD